LALSPRDLDRKKGNKGCSLARRVLGQHFGCQRQKAGDVVGFILKSKPCPQRGFPSVRRQGQEGAGGAYHRKVEEPKREGVGGGQFKLRSRPSPLFFRERTHRSRQREGLRREILHSLVPRGEVAKRISVIGTHIPQHDNLRGMSKICNAHQRVCASRPGKASSSMRSGAPRANANQILQKRNYAWENLSSRGRLSKGENGSETGGALFLGGGS